MQHYLGIDIAKLKFDCALLSTERTIKCSFPNTPTGFEQLLQWLRQSQVNQCHAGMEATGSYGLALANFLHEHSFRVSVINAARIKFFAQSLLSRNKTDSADAEIIARFCQQQQPAQWQPLSEGQMKLQSLSRFLQELIGQQQDNRNRLENATCPPVIKCLKQLDKQLGKHIANVQKQIRQHLGEDQQLQKQNELLQSIPGIGEATAATILAELPPDLPSARTAAAYAGVTPRQKQSGSSLRGRTALSKTGNSRLRKALYFPAITALKWNPLIREMAERLLARGKSKMCVVGAAMRKLLHLIYGVLKHQQPFNPKWQNQPVTT